jgi:uncharacterized Zn finger protein (UPF0148 family)
MSRCQAVGCKNEADPRLVHKYSGKVFCPSCAKRINGWNSKEDVVPIPDGLVETVEAELPAPVHSPTGMFVPRPRKKRLKGPE